MLYVSTRGRSPPLRFCDILLGGLAPDGGLYLPDHYPRVTCSDLASWRRLSYADLAFAITSLFIDDIPPADLKLLIDKTYTADVYRYARPGTDPHDIAPLRWLKRGCLALLCLSNGPTLAFKDMAMQLLGNLFEYVLAKRSQRITILGATSGDTGSAAEYAMRGKSNVSVFMLSPHGRMSAFQRAQMYSLPDANIYNVAIEGMFDDCQDVVKAVFADADFKNTYRIGAVNSINWGRVVAQVIYYFWGYFRATEDDNTKVTFAVPTGNFGNICAGHIAKQMGLPIEKLILATNENDVLDEFFKNGVYRPRSPTETFVTSSPSMDISKASNFERFIFDLVGRDGEEVRRLYSQTSFDITDKSYFTRLSLFGFVSGKSSHAERVATIKKVSEQYEVVIDTHTADAFKVASEWPQPEGVPVVVLETAQACKFPAPISEALGKIPETPPELVGIEELPQRVDVMSPDPELVKAYIAARIEV